jgi:hypothetical protein
VDKSITIPPLMATQPQVSPVPAPRGIRVILLSLANFVTETTSGVEQGITTASGLKRFNLAKKELS